jgi:spermidine synthase
MIKIRNCKRKDIDSIISIYKSNGWWKDCDNKKQLIKLIKNSHCFIVAQDKGKIIAMGRAISDKSSDAYIQDLAVIKEYRNKGIGLKIVKKIIEILKKDKINWIGLIAQNNTEKFYEKLGFKIMENSKPMIYGKF